MNFERNKKVDIIFALIAISSLIWMFFDYESWTTLDRMPSGKGAKLGMLIIYFLDKIGGKIFTISTLAVLVSPYVIGVAKMVIKGEDYENLAMNIKPNETFIWKGYEIIVKEVTKTENGLKGKGIVEIGIVNKEINQVEFENIQLNPNYKSVKGEVYFIDNENYIKT